MEAKKVLFVNACMRGVKESRTLELCRHFLKKYSRTHPKDTVYELPLMNEPIRYLSGDDIALRNDLIREGSFQDSMFLWANQFASADIIVIGAPCWDLSFPAQLKIYIENICVNGITFHYTEEGRQEGLSKFTKMLYITTSGGYIEEGKNYGSDYLKGIAAMLGNGAFSEFSVQGLDIEDNNAADIMRGAIEDIRALAETF